MLLYPCCPGFLFRDWLGVKVRAPTQLNGGLFKASMKKGEEMRLFPGKEQEAWEEGHESSL